MTKAKVLKLTLAALKKFTYPNLGAELVIDAEDLRKDGDWWLVPVHPSKELSRVYPYYDVLAMAMEELESQKLKVQFVPV